MAMSSASALRNAFLVMIASGVVSLSTGHHGLAVSLLFAACPGRLPYRSVARQRHPERLGRQLMLLAVKSPEQQPGPGQAHLSISASSSSLTASEAAAPSTLISVTSSYLCVPVRSAPGDHRRGHSHARHGHQHAGDDLVAVGILPRVEGVPITIISTLQEMTSREGSEELHPVVAIARPSQTPMVLNSNGVPPAS